MLPFPIMNQYGNTVVHEEYNIFKSELQNGSTYKNTIFNSNFGSGGTAVLKMYGTVISSTTGTMWGTPYGTQVTYDSYIHYAVRHMYPSQSMWQTAVSAQRLVAFTSTARITYGSYISLDRNGYKSSSYGSFTGLTITDFIYFDENTGHVMRYNPNTMSTPVRYYNT